MSTVFAYVIAACPNVLLSLVDRLDDFTVAQTIRVFCGTWNVNGGQRFDSVAFRGQQSLSDWLLDLPQKSVAGQLSTVAFCDGTHDAENAATCLVPILLLYATPNSNDSA